MESTKLLQAIIENAIEGIITIDDEGLIESINPAAIRLFGYEPHELIGKNISHLMTEPYKSRHDADIAHYLNTGQKKIIRNCPDVLSLKKIGSSLPSLILG